MDISMNHCALWVYCVYCFSGICPVGSMNIICNYGLSKVLRLIDDIENLYDTTSKYNDTNMQLVETVTLVTKLRVKRQGGAGKYTDAAKMPQVKVMRLFLQMLRNPFSDIYVGGAHPLHHEIPKAFVQLFVSKILAFFFPDMGGSKQ